jgi:hypothetical protein
MRRVWIILFLVIICMSLYAYSQAELEQLRNNSEWIVGKGLAKDENQADKLAVSDLLSQICIEVESSFESLLTEENSDVKEYCASSLKTYSNTKLEGAERSIFETKNGYVVYRYIRKADKNRIFADRKDMALSYLDLGQRAETELRIGDALQNYYWALILLRTLPDWSNITQNVNGTNQTLITFIPNRIRRMLSLLQFSITDKRYDKIDKVSLLEVSALYDNKPVQNLDIVYYGGSNWSEPLSLANGKGLLEFYGDEDAVPKSIGINVVYNSEDKSSFNTEILRIIEDVELPAFTEGKLKLTLPEIKASPEFEPKMEVMTAETTKAEVKEFDYRPYVDKANLIYQAINRKDYQALDKNCNESGKQYVKDILQYGNSRPVSQNVQLKCEQNGDKIVIRGLPAQFSFPKSGRKFNELLAFTFDKEGNLDKVNFALSEQAVNDILGNTKVSELEKQQIIGFVEDYKTAYSLKNIDYIEKVFSDNALIIVGSMLKDDPDINLDGMYNKLGKKWKATQYSKQEYVANLKKLFAANEYVNLRLEDNRLNRNNNPQSKVYGIQIHQYYYSQHYADEGYLFLMFDLADTLNPKIHVRTWQPDKNTDGSVYGLKDFFVTE